MKKVFAILIMSMMTLMTWAENTVTLSTTSGHPGDEVTVTASLTNTDAIVAAEIKIPLNEYMEYVEGSASLNSERSNGHSISSVVKNDTLVLYVYSFNNAALKGNSGELCSLKVILGKEPATYSLKPEVVLSNASGTKVSGNVENGVVTLLSPKLTITTPEIDFGHQPIRATYTKTLTLNNSGNEPLKVSDIYPSVPELTVTEKNFTIAAGRSKSLTLTYKPTVRGSIAENVSIFSDAVNGMQKATIKADPYSVNILSVVGASGISDNEVTVGLSLQNMEPITGVQCSFTLPSALQYVDGSLAVASRSTGMSCDASISNGKLILYLYSTTNVAIAEGSGQICTFKVLLNGQSGSYSLSPNDVVLSNITLENMVSSTKGGTVTIQSPRISGNSSLSMGNTDVTKTAISTYTVSNTGQTELTISKVNFLADGYSVQESFPITVASGSSTTLTVKHIGDIAGSYSTTMNIYSNDPDTRMKTVSISGTFFEPNTMSIYAEQCDDKGNQKVMLSLDNYSNIVAAQMDIHCTTGYSIDNSDIVKTARLNGIDANVYDMGDNVYRLVIYSLANTPISSKQGQLLSFIVKPTTETIVGSTMSIDNIMLSNVNGENMASNQYCSVVFENIGIKGDVNHDGNVDINDVNAVISVICGDSSYKDYADVNGDGNIDINDVNTVIDIICGQ